MSDLNVTGKLPVLALRGLVVFPEQTIHFDIGRMKSALALEEAMRRDQTLLLVPQKNLLDDDPGLKDLYPVGTVVKVKQILKSHNDNVRVLVTGLYRARLHELTKNEPFLAGIYEKLQDTSVSAKLKNRALCREYGTYSDMLENPAHSVHLRIMASEDSGFVADSIAQHSGIDFKDKAKLLSQLNPVKRLENAISLLRQEVQMLQLESDIQEKTRAQMDQNQRDYYLREQIKAIREELGEGDENSEFAEYERSILALHLSEESQKKLLKDLERLKKQVSPFSIVMARLSLFI